MSMIGQYRRITLGQLSDLQDALRDNPTAVSAFLHPEERTYDRPDPKLEIGKAWGGIHFLLCGDKWEGSPPLNSVVMGGTEIGEDLGYGPVRYLSPQEVQETAAALGRINETGLRARFDPGAFEAASIYPGGWAAPNRFTWLWDNLMAVRNFFQEAAQYRDVMLLYLN